MLGPSMYTQHVPGWLRAQCRRQESSNMRQRGATAAGCKGRESLVPSHRWRRRTSAAFKAAVAPQSSVLAACHEKWEKGLESILGGGTLSHRPLQPAITSPIDKSLGRHPDSFASPTNLCQTRQHASDDPAAPPWPAPFSLPSQEHRLGHKYELSLPRSSPLPSRVMNSTPVRVRGKRKPLPFAAMPPSLKKMKRPLSSVLASRSARRRPTLESLPAEILESILLYSCNLALPRASPLLGLKLSDRVTLLRLFIWAFHDTWEQWFGIPQCQSVHHVRQSAREYQVPCQGDPVLQSAILELSWVDIDFILQAQQTWADRYARGRWYQHSVPWRGDGRELLHDHRGGFGHFDARACFEADYQQALRTHLRFEESRQWRARDVHPRTRMPDRLIVGPWDQEQLSRLFWLTRAGIRLDENQQSLPPWEMRLQCLDNAVTSAPQPSALVVNCMMGTWIFVNLPRDAVTRALSNLDRRLDWGGDAREGRVVLRWARSSLSLSLGLTYYPAPIGNWGAR